MRNLKGVFVGLCWIGTLSQPLLGQAIEARVGVAQPVGELGEMVDAGVAAAIGVEFPVTSRVGLTFRGLGEFFSGFPNVQAWHYLAGARIRVIDPAASKWRFAVRAAAGGTFFGREDTAQIPEAPPLRALQLDTSLTIAAGVEMGRALSSRLEWFAGLDWILMFTHGEAAPGFESVSMGFDQLASIPVAVGIRWRR